MGSSRCRPLLVISSMLAALLVCSGARGQTAEETKATDGQQELGVKIETLSKSLEQTQLELAESRTEIRELRAMLQEMLKRMDTGANAAGTAPLPAQTPGGSEPTPRNAGAQTAGETQAQAAQISQDDWDMLNARVTEQRQTKVESGSKFRLKLSGLALFNAFSTAGAVDNIDVPSLAVPRVAGSSAGALGASLRQSILGLTGYGPVIWGAKTSADLQMDFFGGLPSGYGAETSGIARLRIARTRFDWENTSVVAGLDYPFFSPNLPSTYMSVAEPGFASAGNLWNWTPTIRVEQRFGGTLSPFKVEAGFLDPGSYSSYSVNTNYRVPSATESSRVPTYAVRFSANNKAENPTTSVGVSGVYSPQTYYNGYQITGWVGALDWKLAPISRVELSGQFFTGRGIDEFGGVPLSPLQPQSAYLYNAFIAPELANMGVIGGWTQFKFKLDARSEFNVAAGTGERKSADLRQAALGNAFVTSVPARNEMIFVNYIFRPRSDLLFSAEYRRFRTYEVNGAPDIAGQVGLALGFLF